MGNPIVDILLKSAPYAGYALAMVFAYYAKLFDTRVQQGHKRERDLRDDFERRLRAQAVEFTAAMNAQTNAARWFRYLVTHGAVPAHYELEDPAEILANVPPPPAT
jgi:hypothetical protein